MAVSPYGTGALGRRLKELRERAGLTQRVIGESLDADRRLSPAQISSWESGRAVPATGWVVRYARFLSELEGPGAPLLTEAELEAELTALRELDLGQQSGAAEPAENGLSPTPGPDDGLGTFWRFPDGIPVRIIGTPMFDSVVSALPYADRWHPNYMESLHNADMDSTIELFGHIRAANPLSDVRFLTTDAIRSDDLTGHVVLLGGGDSLFGAGRRPAEEGPLSWFFRRLDLPVRFRQAEGGDPEFDTAIVVRTDARGRPDPHGGHEQIYRPTFLRDQASRTGARLEIAGLPRLEYDLGLFARQVNPMNLQATVTVCAGVFNRGTYGVVRAITDGTLRAGNEQYLAEAFPSGTFWMLMRVPVIQGSRGADTITPDLTREFHTVVSS
ncbi:MAG: helix-turn-helix transcriptional regulator [Kineosporiaceae bacterium]